MAKAKPNNETNVASEINQFFSLSRIPVEQFLEGASSIEGLDSNSLFVIDLRASKSGDGRLKASTPDCRIWFDIPIAAIEHITPLGLGCHNDPGKPLVSISFREGFEALGETFQGLTSRSAGPTEPIFLASASHDNFNVAGDIGASAAAFTSTRAAGGFTGVTEGLRQFNGQIHYGPIAAFIIGVSNPPPALIHQSTPTSIGSGASYFQSKGKQENAQISVVGALSHFGTEPCIFFITGS